MIAKRVTSGNKDYARIKYLYTNAFPKQERIPFDFLALRSKANWIDFLAFYDKGQFCGIVCLSKSEKLINILYLAVETKMRSKGYGSKILKFIQNKYKDHTIVLDIEIVDQGADNYEQRKMRKEFYIRNGFMESGYGVTIYGVKYEVLKNKKAFTQKEWCKLSRRLTFGIVRFKLYPIN